MSEPITYQVESLHYFHGRPQGGDRYWVDAIDLDEATACAIASESRAHLDPIRDTSEERALRIEIWIRPDGADDGPMPVAYWDGFEWQDSCRCEVCDTETLPDIQLDENLCPTCAAGYDSDYARSYGPNAEIERLRQHR